MEEDGDKRSERLVWGKETVPECCHCDAVIKDSCLLSQGRKAGDGPGLGGLCWGRGEERGGKDR